MHYDGEGNNASKHYAALKGLKGYLTAWDANSIIGYHQISITVFVLIAWIRQATKATIIVTN